MSADQPSPLVAYASYINCAANLYFLPLEIAEAQRLYKESGSYTEAIAYLVGCGDDLRHTSAYLTIPGGKVHLPYPNRPGEFLPYISIPLIELARRAFPDPQSGAESSVNTTRRQLSFWDEAELVASGQGTPMALPKRAKPTHPRKLTYVEQPIARRYGPPVPGWVVKDKGLGYLAEPIRSGDGYSISLIHLKSKREMASVLVASLDHEPIRVWVSACALLTDWNQGIQAILKEKPGEKKQLAWSRQLEGIWCDQQTKVKRQLAFF